MKLLFSILLLLGLAQVSRAQQMPATLPAQHLNVAILVYPGVGLGDLDGPLDVFTKARGLTKGQYHVYTVALKPGPIRTQGGALQFTPDYVASRMPRPDILVVPGGTIGLVDSMARQRHPAIAFIAHYRDSVQVLMSVCTGAYLLGQAGALTGHKATTHFFNGDDLLAQYPGFTLVKDVRFVQDGKLLTTAGISTGMDGAMHLVAHYSGERTAASVAGALQYTPREAEPWPKAVDGMKFDREWRKQKGLLMK
jgi:transcriptional regulator GlxA family with amidase domain